MDNNYMSEGGKSPVVIGISVLCNLGMVALLGYFFGHYWLANPDALQADGTMLNCWAPNRPLAANVTNYVILPGNATPADLSYINVTQGFLVWFEWGFIIQMINAAAFLCGALMCVAPNQAGAGAAGILGCSQCAGSIWFIVGMVLRWRKAGNICSGGKLMVSTWTGVDAEPGLLVSSGNFINVWLIINLSVLGCCCVTACCLGICSAVMGSR